jgi:hypothetical protein
MRTEGDTGLLDESTVASAPALRRWHVDVGDRSDLVFPLRDYFRKLGDAAEVEGPTFVELRTHRDPAEVRQHAATWARANDAAVKVEEIREQMPGLAAPVPRSGSPRLGTLLITAGYLTPEQLAGALAESQATGDLLGVVLLREQLIFEDELARTLSKQLSIPYISVGRVGVNPYVARLLPPEVGEATASIPIRATGATLQVAFADPTDSWALAEVCRYLPNIEIVVAELSDIRLAWRGVTETRG